MASLVACSWFDPCESKGNADEQLQRTIGTRLDHSRCAETACFGDASPGDAARLWSAASAAMVAVNRRATPSICEPIYAFPDVREQQAAIMGEGSQCTWVYWYLVSANAGKVCASVELAPSFWDSVSLVIGRLSH
jgi:hypothetical protein